MTAHGSQDDQLARRADAGTDRDLLTRFVRHQDERAFTAIVGRHGALVLGVCQRVLRDSHAAEDAFQATFLVLAKSARKIRKRRSLASWLHGVAHRIAVRSLGERLRRREQSSEMSLIPTPTPVPAPLSRPEEGYEQQLVDAELRQLPEKYREPLILHYLQGLTSRQVAEQLGMSVTAVDGRLKRGKKALRLRLMRRSIELGAAVATLSTFQSAWAAHGLTALVAVTGKAAAASACGTVTSAISPHAAGLAGKELAMITASKLMMTLSVGAAVLAGAAGLGAVGAGVAGATGGGLSQADESAAPGDGIFGFADGAIEDRPAARISPLAQVPADGASLDLAEATEDTTAAAGQTARVADQSRRSAGDAKIEALLNGPTSFEFPGNPFRDVLEYFSQVHDFPILIDEQALTDAGISADEEVNIVLSDISLKNALELLLKNFPGERLDYVIANEVMTITTREKANATVETRVYSLRHLGPEFDAAQLANVIRKTVSPDSWAHIEISREDVDAPDMTGMGGMAGGGFGGSGYVAGSGGGFGGGYGGGGFGGGHMMGSGGSSPAGLGRMQIDRTQAKGQGSIETLPGCLIVTQSQRVHREISQLLEQLQRMAAETPPPQRLPGAFGGLPGGSNGY